LLLLRTKRRVPAVSDHYVRRARLLGLLDAAPTKRLTLVCAPAGSGKTTLAAGWHAERAAPSAWISLDGSDRDARQFWTSVISALQTISPELGTSAAAMLRGLATIGESVDELLNDLEEANHQPTVLVIDDLHAVDANPAVLSSLETFAERMPRWLHLIVLSRWEVHPLRRRMAAMNELIEIRFAELRFSHDEARELMTRLASRLSEEEIAAAAAHADGWAAGLQLAALAARSARAQREFDVVHRGGDMLVQDYILREILAGEVRDIVEALCDLAIVRRVNAQLARALVGRSDAARLLETAEARGLFVSRLDSSDVFEIHSLLGRALIAELAGRSPARLIHQHKKAARWFEQHDEMSLALDHWLRADEPREALRLLATEHANLYYSGRAATIKQTIDAIASHGVLEDLESMIEFAWCHLLVDRRRFLDLVDEAAGWASSEDDLEAVLEARLTMLRSIAETMTGSWAQGGALARRAMHNLAEHSWRDSLGRFGWNMIARDIALSERWGDEHDDVHEARSALGEHPARRLAFEGTRAMGEALAGHPVDALRIAAGVRRAAAVTDVLILRAELAIAEGVAHREIGDRSRATDELTALADAASDAMPYCQILACLELVRACLDAGDLDAARTKYLQAQSLVETESFGRGGQDWLFREGVRLALARGEDQEAIRFAQDIHDPFWRSVSAARIALAHDATADALRELTAATPRCVRHEVVLGLLKAQADEDRDEAARLARTAAGQAAAAGILQTVASEGPEVVALVCRTAFGIPRPWLDRLRRATVPHESRASGGRLVEALTEREHEVLSFLPSRLSTREIAGELFVSVNTLKFHLKIIYRKLGVGTRAEAAEVARGLSRIADRV
jgi:LuxR family maltose regulon positive regulatory protein